MNQHPALKIFSELLEPSPSGDEDRVAGKIKNIISDVAYAHETDPAGNIIVHLHGINSAAPVFTFTSHMDEIGMVVNRIDPDGKLRVSPSGGLQPWKLGEGAVEIYGDTSTIKGVLSMGSTHTSEADTKAISWKDVYILTGLEPTSFKNAGIRPGSPVLPTSDRRGPVIFGPRDDPLVGAWTFDDRMGCVTLLRLLKSLKDLGIQPYHPTNIAFTTREEIGGHGAKFLARSTNPVVFVAIDGCPKPPGSPLELDGRPGIWVKDRIAQYDQGLIRAFSKAAIQAGTELQPVVYESAASDASLVADAMGVPRIACLGHVRDNSHGFEVARLSVFDNLLDLLLVFFRTFGIGDA